MDELTNLVVQKTGINQDDAQKVVQAVIDILKSRLPGPMGGEIDKLLTTGLGGGVSGLEAEAETLVKDEMGSLLGKL